jgi:hypothetical protein
MVVPGTSVSEWIEAVDWTIKFIIDLKNVGDEVKDLVTDLQRSSDHLKRLEELLRKCPASITCDDPSFKSLRTDHFCILDDAKTSLNQFRLTTSQNTGRLSKLSKKVKWVVDSRYQGTITGLQDRISKHKCEIDRWVALMAL